MTTTAYKKHSAHWGAFEAELEDGRVVGVRPFANPCPMRCMRKAGCSSR
ncbi:MAG: hypothetical protein ACKVH0_21925 [Alphaproteobacteria bacterium]